MIRAAFFAIAVIVAILCSLAMVILYSSSPGFITAAKVAVEFSMSL